MQSRRGGKRGEAGQAEPQRRRWVQQKLTQLMQPACREELAEQELQVGERFVVIGDDKNPHAIAIVVAVNDRATARLSGARGEMYNVRIIQFESEREVRNIAGSMQARDMSGCRVVDVSLGAAWTRTR